MFKIITILVGISISAPAICDDTLSQVRESELNRLDSALFSSIADDVYVQLYLTRLVRTRLQVTEQEAAVIYALNNVKRMAKLLQSNAASLQEYEEGVRDYDAEKAKLEQTKARVEEMRAMFNIAVDRVSVGLDMPVCAEMP